MDDLPSTSHDLFPNDYPSLNTPTLIPNDAFVPASPDLPDILCENRIAGQESSNFYFRDGLIIAKNSNPTPSLDWPFDDEEFFAHLGENEVEYEDSESDFEEITEYFELPKKLGEVRKGIIPMDKIFLVGRTHNQDL